VYEQRRAVHGSTAPLSSGETSHGSHQVFPPCRQTRVSPWPLSRQRRSRTAPSPGLLPKEEQVLARFQQASTEVLRRNPIVRAPGPASSQCHEPTRPAQPPRRSQARKGQAGLRNGRTSEPSPRTGGVFGMSAPSDLMMRSHGGVADQHAQRLVGCLAAVRGTRSD
jgi:hypothetical protein